MFNPSAILPDCRGRFVPDNNPAMLWPMSRIRILTCTDLHQSKLHYRSLALSVMEQQPDAVALVGDFLYGAPIGRTQFSTAECVQLLADLDVKHLLFVRGNHEDVNWSEFVQAWPFERRPLTALYGSTHAIGPLTIMGFPCKVGSEFTWCHSLPQSGNVLTTDPKLSGRPCLTADTSSWMPGLMRRLGPAGRVIWLMHEPPVGEPLAKNELFQPAWRTAVEHYSPSLVVSGHDHDTPLSHGRWWVKHRNSTCVNVGQAEMDFHHCIIDFEFQAGDCLPTRITVRAFPQGESFVVTA